MGFLNSALILCVHYNCMTYLIILYGYILFHGSKVYQNNNSFCKVIIIYLQEKYICIRSTNILAN